MRKIKFFSAVVVFLMISASVFALDLDTICMGLSEHKVTRGNFTQIKTVNSAKGKRDLKSYGVFVLCSDGIIWDTQKPFPSKMIIGKTKIIQTSLDGKQSIINGDDNITFANISATVSAVFSNNIDEINRNFNTSVKSLPDNKWELSLYPKDATIASAIGEIVLTGTVAGSSVSLDSMSLKESENSNVTYQFTDQIYVEELTSDEKAFFAL